MDQYKQKIKNLKEKLAAEKQGKKDQQEELDSYKDETNNCKEKINSQKQEIE